MLVDEVLTPDSSRFWPADKYELGKAQDSFDKVSNESTSSEGIMFTDLLQQYLRDWLTSNGLKGKDGVEMPEDVVKETASKYQEAFEKLTGKKWEDAIKGRV